jgi:succinate dehydrogenase/fumarate reductase flavoprotein subunit
MLQPAHFGVVDGPFGPLLRARAFDEQKEAMKLAKEQARLSKVVVDTTTRTMGRIAADEITPENPPFYKDPVILAIGGVGVVVALFFLLRR